MFKGKLLLLVYDQFQVVQFGEIYSWSLVGGNIYQTINSLSNIHTTSLWQIGRIKAWRSFQVDPSGEIIEFTEGGCPWKEHLFDLEKELEVEVPIKFAVFSDQNGKWRVQVKLCCLDVSLVAL